MIYLQLLWVYLKIGTFGFGGGYAMLSLIQHEIVDLHHWLTPQQFTDVVAISQMTPGPIGINSATYVGYAVTHSVWAVSYTHLDVYKRQAHNMAAMSVKGRIQVQATLSAVKEMAGWTIYAGVICMIFVLVVPYPKRKLLT